MHINYKVLRRPVAVMSALALVVGAVAPVFLESPAAYAASQLGARSIRMSDSAPSGTAFTGVGSGDAVKYTISITTSSAMQSFVLDFCDATPLIGDNCTVPTGFDASTATLTALATWSLGTNTAGHVPFTSSASKVAGTYTFELNGITNPDTTGSFYARVTTYADATYGSNTTAYSTPLLPGDYVEYGGIGLSTTKTITITARVMEKISLCASGGVAVTNATDLGSANACGAASVPSVKLGTTPDYLLGYTGATPSSANIYTQLSTNASGGYALYLRANNTSCGGAGYNGGLSRDGGTTCEIPPINAGSATAIAFANNVAAFGAFVSDGVAATGGIGANTAVTRWSGSGSTYLMDTTTGSDNVIGAYGSKIAQTTGTPYQADSVNNTITFAAVASPTTPAGIYSENFTLVGVGTF